MEQLLSIKNNNIRDSAVNEIKVFNFLVNASPITVCLRLLSGYKRLPLLEYLSLKIWRNNRACNSLGYTDSVKQTFVV